MKKILLSLIKFYQKVISPLFPSCCRFTPTCSVYSYQAIERFGIVKGLKLAIARVSRCHPYNQGGYDPVPLQLEEVSA